MTFDRESGQVCTVRQGKFAKINIIIVVEILEYQIVQEYKISNDAQLIILAQNTL